jgi:hypothetical protein
MFMKKKVLNFATLLLTTILFAACEPETPVQDESITLSSNNSVLTQTAYADETQGSDGVTFVTTNAWTSTITEESPQMRAAAPDWITISPDHGDKAGAYTITITLVPNTTGEDRTATITISCEGTEITITVTQKGTKEDGTVPEYEPQPFVIEAQVENGAQYDVDEVQVYLQYHGDGADLLLASGKYENGAFKITLPATFDENYLNELGTANGVTVSNPNARYAMFDEIAAYKNSEAVGIFSSGYNPNIKVQYMYLDRDVTINGTLNDDNDPITYDIIFKKGWNMVYAIKTENEITLTTQPQSGMKWYYQINDPVMEEVGLDTVAEGMKRLYNRFIGSTNLIDAALTHEASVPYYNKIADFSFDPYDSRIHQIWIEAYQTILRANFMLEKINRTADISAEEKNAYRVEALYHRAYVYAILLNYFGGVPLVTTTDLETNMNIHRASEQEVVDFIKMSCDEAYNFAPSSAKIRYAYAAQQIKARVLLNNKDFFAAANALEIIINSEMMALPTNLAWGKDAISEGISFSSDEYPSVMQKGDLVYPVRYVETLLMYAEISLADANYAKAIEIINQFATVQGLPLTLSQGASSDEIQTAIDNLWSSRMDREGLTFARLKRNGKFLETLGQYGATEKHKLLPIPAPEVNSNPNLSQNPGW